MLAVHPLTADRWSDLEDLFGKDKGGNSGCWCMWPRLSAKAFNEATKDQRKQAFRGIVLANIVPGLLAYEDDVAVAWVSVGPRGSVFRFNASKASKLDGDEDNGLYAITCFLLRADRRLRADRPSQTRPHARARNGRDCVRQG